MEDHHAGDAQDFSFKARASHKTSLQRQLMEAILIAETTCDIKMNRKGEWGLNMIPTLGTMVLGGLGEWETTTTNTNSQEVHPPHPDTNQEAEVHDDDDLTFGQRKRRRKQMESEADTLGTVQATPRGQETPSRRPKTSKEQDQRNRNRNSQQDEGNQNGTRNRIRKRDQRD